MSFVVFNREIPTELHEILKPGQTAVLVVDVQNDFCSPGGRADQRGSDLGPLAAAIARMAPLLDDARRHGVPVFYIQNTVLPEGRLSPVSDLARRAAMWGAKDPLITVKGSWGHAIVDRLAPAPRDLVIEKYRQTAFVGTNLELALRATGVSTVVVVGVETHGCVEATARDAMNRDFSVVLVRDCVAACDPALHEASLAVMEALLPKGWVTDAASVRKACAESGRGRG